MSLKQMRNAIEKSASSDVPATILLGSDNVCSDNSSDSDSESETGRLVCAGCGQPFILTRPWRPRKYCRHSCYSTANRVDIAHRLWSRVNRNDPSGCWLWTASTMRGYGQLTGVYSNGKRGPVYAHRVSWQLSRGPIPDGLCVLHKCDVPLCVNPDHLFLGTQRENMQDAWRKGRMPTGPRDSKFLKYADRVAIYETKKYPGFMADLALKYGITKQCVETVRRGRFVRLAKDHVNPPASQGAS